MVYGEHCDTCPLKGKGDIVKAKGADNARFLVVTDAPNFRPEAYGRLMTQSALKKFGNFMEAEQFGKDDFVFHPHVRCPYDPDIYSTKEKGLMAKSCRPYLLEAIAEYEPEVVIPLGVEPSKQVFGRAVKITKVRGIAARSEEFPKSIVMPMLNPIMVVMYPQHESTFAADCATLGRLVDSNYDIEQAGQAVLGDYTIIDDLQFLVDMKPKVVGYDTENTGLSWFAPDAKILTMQFCVEEGTAYLLPWDHPDRPQSSRAKQRLRRQLTELLCRDDVTVIGQNAKYDAVYTYAQTGVRYRIGGCTLMLATLLDENSLTKNLDDLVKRYVPAMAGYADGFNATVDKSKMIELPLDDKFVAYGAGDADAVLRVYNVLYPMLLEDDKLVAHYERVTLPGLNAFSSVELRGLCVDEAAVEEFEAFMEERVSGMESALLSQVPKSIKRAHAEKGIKFSRKEFLLDVLFNHPDGFKLKPQVFTKTTAKLEKERRVPSTSTKDHLPYFYDKCPFTYELSEYVKSARILGTNVQGFKAKYIIDGMVRPTYNLHTAVTGRSSSTDPNGQNFPKRGPIAMAYRKLFVAPPRHFLIEADLSQAELRIAGDMANDPTMVRIYREAGDIHTYTALIVLRVSMEEFRTLEKKEQKDARTKAKAVNFGFLYGMGWRKFIAYAKTQYGVEFTDKEAQRIRTDFFSRYSKLAEWHGLMRAYAKQYKEVRSYSGRLRHLPMIDSPDEMTASEAERAAINCLSDDTEILTIDGWRTVDEVAVGTIVYSVNPDTGEVEADSISALHTGQVDGRMLHLDGGAIDAIATPNHRWLVDHRGQGVNKGKVLTSFKTSEKLSKHGDHKIWLAGAAIQTTETTWTDDEVLLLGWVLTDGHYRKGERSGESRVGVTQSKTQNVMEIDRLFNRLGKHSTACRSTGQYVWEISCPTGLRIREMMPDKTLTGEVLSSMSSTQHRILFEAMLRGDGCWDEEAQRYRKFCAGSKERADAFLMLCVLVGQSASATYRDTSQYAPKKYASMGNIPKTEGHWLVELKQRPRAQPQYGSSWVAWRGRVWCPTTRNQTWIAKRNGKVFITGNSPVQGFGSDLGIMACGRIDLEVNPRYLSLVGFVHDAIYAYVPKEYVEWGAKTLKWYMESNPLEEWFGRRMRLPIVADVGFGLNLSEVHEMGAFTTQEEPTVGDYNFDALWEANPDGVIHVPRQRCPPNNGRL